MDKFLWALNNALINKSPARKYVHCIVLFCIFSSAHANALKAIKNVKAATSVDAELSDITISNGTLSPVFAAGTFNYTAAVADAVSSLTVTPSSAEPGLKIAVNNIMLSPGSPSVNIVLNTGDNVINIVTTSQDGTMSKTYTLTVSQALSSDAGLASLSLSNTALIPSFSTGISSYAASITNTAANHVIYTMGDSITADGGYQTALDSLLNHLFTFVNLGVGGDQTSGMLSRYPACTTSRADYIIILGGVNDMIFDATATDVETNLQAMYTAAHNSGIKVIALTILPWKGGAKWTPERQAVTDTVNVWISHAAANIDYVVDANAALSDPTDPQQLLPLYNRGDFKHPSPAGQKEIANVIYANTSIAPNAAVDQNVSSTVVAATANEINASVKVNDVLVQPGAGYVSLPLNMGENIITGSVMAQDGITSKNYTVTLTRKPSSNADLSNIIINSGTKQLTPSFAEEINNYAITVTDITSLMILPVALKNGATIKINGVTFSSANPLIIPTLQSSNVINILVTAEDGVTTRIYSITVTRISATLSNIIYSPAVTKTTVTGSNYRDYTATVANTVTSIAVTPTLSDLSATIKVNGIAVKSGTTSALIALNVGVNVINTVVTGQDSITTKNYALTITRLPSSDATLANIIYSPAITKTTVSGSNFRDYAATVANMFTSVTVMAVLHDVTGAITVNGIPLASGVVSAAVPLTVGLNVINTVVTAQDGVTIKNYSITITRQPSADATLSSISYSPSITTTQVNGPNFQNLIATVPNAFIFITVTPTLADSAANIKVNGTPVASGGTSAQVPLNVGLNIINTVVTAQDGTTIKNYSIAITRQPSSDATLSNITYSPVITTTQVTGAGYQNLVATVGNAFTAISVIPVLNEPNASIKVNNVPVSSGIASAEIPLNVGANIINTVITAQDGFTSKNYTLTITRLPSTDATLSNITYSPAVTKTTVSGTNFRDYTATVANTFTSVTVMAVSHDVTSSIKVNNVALASGTVSAAIPLNIGLNVINTVVIAQDGTTIKNYSITITRQASSDATLSSIAYSPAITKTTVTGTNFRDYTATVPGTFTSIAVTALLHGPEGSISVNGVSLASGIMSAPIPLNIGSNIINTVVTAQDGITTKTYRLTLIRTGSNNALLTALKVTPATTLTKVIGPGFSNYTTPVPNSESSLTVTPTAQDANSTITVNGIAVASGVASQSIPLAVGDNRITLVCTAQDGATTKTYNITATRAPSGMFMKYDDPAAMPIKVAGVTVHQSLSPNGDGDNDVLKIDGITNYPDNNLQIISRSGELIYQVKGYDNQTKAFDGQSNVNGKLQPAGTYFYSLGYKDGNETKHKTGFIVLKY